MQPAWSDYDAIVTALLKDYPVSGIHRGVLQLSVLMSMLSDGCVCGMFCMDARKCVCFMLIAEFD